MDTVPFVFLTAFYSTFPFFGFKISCIKVRSTMADAFFAGRGDWLPLALLGALFSIFITAGILFEELIILFAALVGAEEGTCTSLLKSVDLNVLDRWSD